jgi:VanZ family protein
MSFYQQVFHQMGVGKYVRWTSVFLLSATALFSYLVVRQMPSHHLTSRFVVEMSQNLYFVGVVLTYLLWGAILKLRETRTRLIQLVLALGIFFSADAATYALRSLFPGLEANFLKWVPPLVGTFLPLAWAYTFTKISEDARLETARVALPRMAAHQHS